MAKLSIVIVSYNTKDVLKQCINSIKSIIKSVDYEIVIVDNNSTDDTKKYLKKIKNKKIKTIFNKENLGFAAGNNIGIKKSKSKYILLLNSDTYFKNDFLGKLLTWMENHKKAGIASCALKNKDGSVQGTGGYFPNLLRVISWMLFIDDIPLINRLVKPFHPHSPKSPFYKGDELFKKEKQQDWVTGAFFLLKKKVVDQVGWLDEKYFMYTEETDFCYRAKKKGWQVWLLPQWNITHLGGASSTASLSILYECKGVKRFYRKHYPKWQYPILIFFLKLGSLLRIFLFGALEGKKSAKIYLKAFLYE